MDTEELIREVGEEEAKKLLEQVVVEQGKMIEKLQEQ